MTAFGGLKVRGELFTVKKSDRLFTMLVDYDIVPSGVSADTDGESVTFLGLGNSTDVSERRFWQGFVARFFARASVRGVVKYAASNW